MKIKNNCKGVMQIIQFPATYPGLAICKVFCEALGKGEELEI